MEERSRATPAACVLVVLTLTCPPTTNAADHRITVGDGTIDVTITGSEPVPVPAMLHWIETAARAVTAYFGRYPVPRIRLFVRAGGRGGISHGVTHGGQVPSIRIQVGNETDEGDLRDDWVLTHEMVHLAFPNLTTDDSWAEEGLATYVEPLARLRLGALSEQTAWSGLIEGLPKGLPRRGDRGLHGTDEWGRTYWGGALAQVRRAIVGERVGNVTLGRWSPQPPASLVRANVLRSRH